MTRKELQAQRALNIRSSACSISWAAVRGTTVASLEVNG
jgi:hypothetical protein